MSRVRFVPFDAAAEEEREAVKRERRALRTQEVEGSAGPDSRFGRKNPDDDEYESVEAFVEHLIDWDTDEYDHWDLQCLNYRLGTAAAYIRRELEGYGLKLKQRPRDQEVRGFTSNPNDRWQASPTHGGGGGDAIVGIAGDPAKRGNARRKAPAVEPQGYHIVTDLPQVQVNPPALETSDGKIIPLQLLGQGTSTTAYVDLKDKWVYSIVEDSRDDGVRDILAAAHRALPDNPHLPALTKFGAIATANNLPDATVWKMPFYLPVGYLSAEEQVAIRKVAKMLSDGKKHRRPTQPLLEAAWAIEQAGREQEGWGRSISADLHPGNLLRDEAGNLVLLDPIADMVKHANRKIALPPVRRYNTRVLNFIPPSLERDGDSEPVVLGSLVSYRERFGFASINYLLSYLDSNEEWIYLFVPDSEDSGFELAASKAHEAAPTNPHLPAVIPFGRYTSPDGESGTVWQVEYFPFVTSLPAQEIHDTYSDGTPLQYFDYNPETLAIFDSIPSKAHGTPAEVLSYIRRAKKVAPAMKEAIELLAENLEQYRQPGRDVYVSLGSRSDGGGAMPHTVLAYWPETMQPVFLAPFVGR